MTHHEQAPSYYVVVNHEEQYSIWADAEPPAGWRVVTGPRTRDECLTHIEATWTDMRPLSARRPPPSTAPGEPEELGPSLVEVLTAREHAMALELLDPDLTEPTARLRERLRHGSIHVSLPDSSPGTLLAVELGEHACRELVSGLDDGRTTLELEGRIVLDGVPLTTRARIDVSTLRGHARFEPVRVDIVEGSWETAKLPHEHGGSSGSA